MGAWVFLLNLVLRRWNRRAAALWIGNAIAALAFSAGHLPGAMVLMNAANPAELPPNILVELFVLNSIGGLAAGERYIRDGLVGAIGVHFCADVVWHVLFPALFPIA